MLRRALHVAALLAWAAVVAQAASLPEATARNAALLRELDLWAQVRSPSAMMARSHRPIACKGRT